jgi:hypothetical protein
MSKEIQTNMLDHNLVEYWGGNKKGVCLQITSNKPITGDIQQETFITLTMEEAVSLCNDLSKFIKEEALRRQALLKEQLINLKELDKTIFREVADLPEDLFTTQEISVTLISKFAPKSIGELNDQ